MTLTSDPLQTENLPDRLQQALTVHLKRAAGALEAISADLAPMTEALAALLSSGKRLRPTFCYWGWRASGGPADSDAIVSAAAGLELLQACALIHDDVMDGSDLRRGLPAVHRRVAALHREQGWTGSADRFGEGAAILLGDLCLAWTDEALFSSGMPVEALLRAKPVLDAMRTEVMAGQYLDLVEQARAGGTADSVAQVMRFKSAKYTVERPLQLGGALAGAPPALQQTFSSYGLALGEAFQLRDDVLGVFGDPARTGKPAGDDLREGKRTLLVVLAQQAASDGQRKQLAALHGNPALDGEGVAELRDILRDTGAADAVEQRIDVLTRQARQAVADSAISEPAREVLDLLALAATARSE